MGDQREQEFGPESIQIWDENAAFWNERFGEGNRFHKELVEPVTEELLDPRPGEVVLDAACGNGHVARRLSTLGCQVVAFDGSSEFINLARSNTALVTQSIDYHVLDATDYDRLVALGVGTFDAVVCNMALMDISNIDPLLRASRSLLNSTGRMVVSISHPCFNHTAATKQIEVVEEGNEIIQKKSLKVRRYLTSRPSLGLGIVGQPRPHYYFNRTISQLLGSCFRAGFVVDDLRESAFENSTGSEDQFSWQSFNEFPAVLIFRLRPALSVPGLE